MCHIYWWIILIKSQCLQIRCNCFFVLFFCWHLNHFQAYEKKQNVSKGNPLWLSHFLFFTHQSPSKTCLVWCWIPFHLPVTDSFHVFGFSLFINNLTFQNKCKNISLFSFFSVCFSPWNCSFLLLVDFLTFFCLLPTILLFLILTLIWNGFYMNLAFCQCTKMTPTHCSFHWIVFFEPLSWLINKLTSDLCTSHLLLLGIDSYSGVEDGKNFVFCFYKYI